LATGIGYVVQIRTRDKAVRKTSYVTLNCANLDHIITLVVYLSNPRRLNTICPEFPLFILNKLNTFFGNMS